MPSEEAITTAVIILTLERFENIILAALSNAVRSFGRVSPHSRAYQPALAAKLIKPSGEPYDLDAFRTAAGYEVDRRVAAGTFV